MGEKEVECFTFNATGQLTIDGKPAPAPPPLEVRKPGRPRLPLHLQTLSHERKRANSVLRKPTAKVEAQIYRRLRKTTSPLLPFTHTQEQRRQRAHQLHEALMEWHATSTDSMTDWEKDKVREWEEDQQTWTEEYEEQR